MSSYSKLVLALKRDVKEFCRLVRNDELRALIAATRYFSAMLRLICKSHLILSFFFQHISKNNIPLCQKLHPVLLSVNNSNNHVIKKQIVTLHPNKQLFRHIILLFLLFLP